MAKFKVGDKVICTISVPYRNGIVARVTTCGSFNFSGKPDRYEMYRVVGMDADGNPTNQTIAGDAQEHELWPFGTPESDIKRVL